MNKLFPHGSNAFKEPEYEEIWTRRSWVYVVMIVLLAGLMTHWACQPERSTMEDVIQKEGGR